MSNFSGGAAYALLRQDNSVSQGRMGERVGYNLS